MFEHPPAISACTICGGRPEGRNNWHRECAIVDCPHRGLARGYESLPMPVAAEGKPMIAAFLDKTDGPV